MRQGSGPEDIRKPSRATLEMMSASEVYVSRIIIKIVVSSTRKLEFECAHLDCAVEEDEPQHDGPFDVEAFAFRPFSLNVSQIRRLPLRLPAIAQNLTPLDAAIWHHYDDAMRRRDFTPGRGLRRLRWTPCTGI